MNSSASPDQVYAVGYQFPKSTVKRSNARRTGASIVLERLRESGAPSTITVKGQQIAPRR